MKADVSGVRLSVRRLGSGAGRVDFGSGGPAKLSAGARDRPP